MKTYPVVPRSLFSSSNLYPVATSKSTVRAPEAVLGARRFRQIALLGIMVFIFGEAGSLHAQDIFEIQVYEYLTVPKGKWNLETHLVGFPRGTKSTDDGTFPTDHRFHLTFELTRGLTDHIELAGYLVNAVRPGGGFEVVGWRVRPRFRLPKSLNLPVDISLSTEFGFPSRKYEDTTATLEIRPIIEKTFENCRLTFNPVVGRALRGEATEDGFDFSPGAKFAYFLHKHANVGLEYYGNTGPIRDPDPAAEQKHIFFPTVDFLINPDTIINVGVGFAATGAGEQLILKTRVGFRF
ncbi:MAG: hypothetical protein HY650_05100 [Acidobacteria bacterium]|nr:hypothetical protein [Acidobacteriota bacterium]